MQYVIYFGVADVIKRLFTLPTFCKAWNSAFEGRGTRDRTHWWGSPDAERLSQELLLTSPPYDLFTDKAISTYAIGFDFAEMFLFKDHSTGK